MAAVAVTHPEQSVSPNDAIRQAAGLLKPKTYDWKDSNMANFGSDTEKKVKKEAAEAEPAWAGAGKKVGLQIWRIEKFKVVAWPKEKYGEFYNGDSYIILNTYVKKGDPTLLYNIHFWIGKYSSQDEYGTAAYKTVELDTLLDDRPVQRREVQGHESDLFKSYFGNNMKILKGGVDTGFRRVLPEAYTPRLFEIKQYGRKVTRTEISLKRDNLKSDNVYIIDNGLKVYQWNGAKASKLEKLRANQELKDIMGKRKGVECSTLEEASTSANHPAIMVLKPPNSKSTARGKLPTQMMKVSDGKLEKMADFVKGNLNPDSVFVVSTPDHAVLGWGESYR